MCSWQHDRPATNIDATFVYRAGLGAGPDGELQSAYSTISGQRFTSVLAATLASQYTLPTAALGYTGEVLIVEANETTVAFDVPAGGAITVPMCGKFDFRLFSVAPVFNNGTPSVCVCVCVCLSVCLSVCLCECECV